LQDGKIHIEGRVGSVDGQTLLRAELTDEANNAQQLGENLARNLLDQGAGDLLKALY
ncbi:hydroxymethylbilane synthase, partial [Acinetobacter baumannii]